MKIRKILPCILALFPLAIINFFYCGVLGCIESIQDTKQEIRAILITGKTWKER